jgi:hypothetical protein
MKPCLLLVIAFFTCTLSAPISAQTARYARVVSENAKLRDSPSVSGASEQEVAEGTLLKILDEKLPWYVVRVRDRVGWIHGNTIEFINTQGSDSGAPSQLILVPDNRTLTPLLPRRESSPDTPARTTGASRGYIRGPRGGCYYLSASGRKVYVDRSLCN